MRGVRRILLGLVIAALPVTASAAGSPTVIQADDGVRVGRDPAWRPAAPGVAIGVADLLDVPEGKKVVVRLTDGSTQELTGRTVVSGKRLASDKSAAGRLVFFNKAYQEAASTVTLDVEETGSTALAVRGRQVDAEQETRLGQRNKGRVLAFLGEDERYDPRSSAADFAESYFRRGEWRLALDAAWLAIHDSSALERRRGHLILGRLAANEGRHDLALRDLDMACRKPATETGSRVYLAAALSQRGQTWLALGDDDRALSDFRSVLDLDPDGAAGAHATFFLGVIALSQQDTDSARNLFGRLRSFPELHKAGEQLLAAAASN